jgi:hypothetical protein
MGSFVGGRTDAQLVKKCIFLWALRPRIDPSLNQISKQLLRAGSRVAPLTGLPTPSNEVVTGSVRMDKRQISAAVPTRVFQLLANFPHRLALPRHLYWS